MIPLRIGLELLIAYYYSFFLSQLRIFEKQFYCTKTVFPIRNRLYTHSQIGRNSFSRKRQKRYITFRDTVLCVLIKLLGFLYGPNSSLDTASHINLIEFRLFSCRCIYKALYVQYKTIILQDFASV